MPILMPARCTELLSIFCALAFSNLTGQELLLDVVYPRQDMTISARDSAFVFGNYRPTEARIFINGIPARQYPNRTFLAFVRIAPGPFVFRAMARLDSNSGLAPDSTVVEQRVYVPPYLSTSPDSLLTIDTSCVFPSEDLEMEPGDLLGVVLKGSPGGHAWFSIEGVADNLPMTERPPRRQFYWGEAVFGRGLPTRTPEVAGIYTGIYAIQTSDSAQRAAIRFYLQDKNGKEIQTTAAGKITIQSREVPRVVRLIKETTVGLTGPGQGFQVFLPAGINLRVSGREGDYSRALLTNDEMVWIPTSDCELLPLGTMPPESTVEVVRTTNYSDRTRVTIYLAERLPFRIEQRSNPQNLSVILYGATADTDWIRYDTTDSLIREICWSQEQIRKYRLAIDLNQKQQWGYRAFYEGSSLVIEIKKTPRIASAPSSPLRNLLICLDPGHHPDFGAVGPTGLAERDANLMLAEAVERKLMRRGAHVILTRAGDHGITLTARTKFAEVSNADLFISLHHNALPDGVNPFINHGASAYYFHSHSLALAESILKKLLKTLKVPNFGLYYDNLAVCRITSMPAVLIEPAFIMHPEEEALILEPRFRERAAEAVVQGIEEFVRAAAE